MIANTNEKADELLKSPAPAGGLFSAEFRAGMAYAQGLGTDADMGEAKRWLTAADDHGYALAAPSLQSLAAKR